MSETETVLLRPAHTQAVLETASRDLVGYLQVPVFNPPAEIVQWGSRTFVRVLDEQKGTSDGQLLPIYREGMLWFAPPDAPYSAEPFRIPQPGNPNV